MVTKQDLVEAGAEKLADLLLEIYNNNKSMQPHLDVVFSSLTNDSHAVIAAIEEQLKTMYERIEDCVNDKDFDPCDLPSSPEYYNMKAVDEFVKYLEQLRGYIANQLASVSVTDAMKLMKRFIGLYDYVVNHENLVEGGHSVNEVFHSACKDMLELHKKAGSSTKEVIEFIMGGVTDEKSFESFDFIISDYKEVLGPVGLDLLQQKFELVLTSKNGYKVVGALKLMADLKSDADAYIKVCTSGSGNQGTRDHIEIAKRLAEHARFDEALNWLESISLPAKQIFGLDINFVKVTIMDKLGRHEEAQTLRFQIFEHRPSKEIYDEILKNFNGQMYAQTAVQKALSFHDVYKGLTFLLAINDIRALSVLVRSRLHDLDGARYVELVPAANALKEFDPLGATLLYRELTESILERGLSRAYVHGVKYLMICEKLSSKISCWGQHQHHRIYKELLKEDYKTKRSFWSTYKNRLSTQNDIQET